MASTMEIGKKLVALCNAGKNMDAVNQLYADNIVSVETHDMPGMPARMEGKAKIIEKTKWWFDNHEIHSSTAEGPWPHGDRFIVLFAIDVTAKAGPMAGKRMAMKEGALFTVKDGKIVKEEFFYDMGG